MKIKWLYIESSSAKHILRAADYPNLYGLALYNMKEKTARRLFTDKNVSCGIFKKQIRRLIITIDKNKKDLFTKVKMCSCIFSIFINLTHLTFSESSFENIVRLLIDVPFRSFSSSSLLVLNIKIQTFSQCLYILDGRFSQLETLYVDLAKVISIDLPENKVKIANLKCFVLSCPWEISSYEELILPLLYRMRNLEKLGLYLRFYVKDRFIDGNHIKTNILSHMPQLNIFSFHIHSLMFINNQLNLPSKEDIHETFIDLKHTKIISYVDYFREKQIGKCHVYSYRSEMQYYQYITNHFLGGLYKYVRLISLYDEHPFEHEFFIKISQSFPFLESLTLINNQSQIYKQSYKSINNDYNSSIVIYNHLITLEISKVHEDYIEEFLFNRKTYFHNNIYLNINYKSLERVTHSFTRYDTRINSAKISDIILVGEKTYSKCLRDYFPQAIIH
ncbi:unnamed protein product [Rotaria sp. Silwood1]|nr:unnamed protein product [Rotaria sp. Silwood1]CAF4886139.1 unnamed protein product [Rotaria sp. Silwood1]